MISGAIRVRRAWLPQGETPDVFLAWDDDGRLTAVRPGRTSDGPLQDGLAVPGLINAHAHLELSHLVGAVPGGAGFLPWLDALWAAGLRGPAESAQAAAHAARAAGTAWMSDVSNRGDTGPWLIAAGLQGVVHHELLGFDGPTLDARITLARQLVEAEVSRRAEAAEPAVSSPPSPMPMSTPREGSAADASWMSATGSPTGPAEPERPVSATSGLSFRSTVPQTAPHQAWSTDPEATGVLCRPSGHALLSTPIGLVGACVDPRLPPATLHLAECEDETEFLLSGTGKVADLLTRLGRDWSWWRSPGVSATAYLHAHKLLGPGLMLVHAVHTSDEDIALMAANGAPVCLCPRSNLHIGGRLPDLERLVRHGVPLAIGTDSLASSPNLDLLAEAQVLAQAAPEVPVDIWVHALTGGGADVVGALGLGRLQVGATPGVLWLADLGDTSALRYHLPADRRWLAAPRHPGGTP